MSVLRTLFRSSIFLFLGLLIAVSPGKARSVSGTIRDQVTTLGIPNVVVKILQTGDSTTTNSSGLFFFPNVTDGSYTFFFGASNYQPLTKVNVTVPNSCCIGKRGNVNCSGGIDLADLSALVSFLTGGGYVLCCQIGSNVNGNGAVDLADLSALVSYLTGGGYVLVNCP
jgi:hypothetical protein